MVLLPNYRESCVYSSHVTAAFPVYVMDSSVWFLRNASQCLSHDCANYCPRDPIRLLGASNPTIEDCFSSFISNQNYLDSIS
jgi:hypothetical protein